MLKTMERMGEMLVSSTTPKASTKLTKTTNTSGMVFFQIKPFKDNDRGISHRDTVSKNIISLKDKKIIFVISGNMADIKMYV